MSNRQQGPGLTGDGPPRALLIAAIAIATAAVIAVLVVAAVTGKPDREPVVIPAVPAPQADGPDCRRLLQALPERLGDYQRSTPAEPVPAGTAAWQVAENEPVVLRCGLDRPTDFVVGAAIQVVNGVQWFAATDAGRSTWFAVDRPVYVAFTLPEGSGPTPIQQLSDVIAATLPAVAIRPGPPR